MNFKKIFNNKIFKETIWSFLNKGTTFVLFFLINILLARKFGVEVFGYWSFLLSNLTIIAIISYFGINASARKYIAQYNKTINLKNIIYDSLKLRIIFSLIFSIILLIISVPLADFLKRPEMAKLFMISSPFIFLSGIVEYLKGVFAGLHRLKYNLIINFLEYGLKLFFVFIVFCFSVSLFGVIISFSASLLVTAIIGIILLYNYFYKRLDSSDINFKKDILTYSFPLFFISIGFIVATEIDTVMIGMLSTDIQVGIYAVAKQITLKLPQIALVVSMGVMPLFAKLNKLNKEKLKKLFYKLLKINALIFGLISLIILGFSDLFLPFLFGTTYFESVLILKLLIPYMVILSFSMFLSSILDYQGVAKKRAINLSISVILNIVFNFILIPQYGANGAAIATSVSYIPYIILNWIEVRKVFN